MMPSQTHPETRLIMGVLNVTPDSFSDGGRFLKIDDAVEQALELVSEGADILDVGGESTRPGAAPVSIDEELNRTAGVIERLTNETGARISIDTRHFEVAAAAVSLGATLVNDTSGGRDIRLAQLALEHPIDLCLMHMQGDPMTMQLSPNYPRGVVPEVKDYLQERVRAFEEIGVSRDRIWIDPGIGFGKTPDHNLDLLQNLNVLRGIGGRILIGTSRKSFLATILGDTEMSLRLEGTLASNLWAYEQGASVFRVHEVAPLVRALKTWESIRYGKNRDRARW